jgi:hypothetical protein
VEFAWKFGIIALVALVLTALPGGGNALDVLLTARGGGVLVWFALLALASYGLFWAWTRYRRYE